MRRFLATLFLLLPLAATAQSISPRWGELQTPIDAVGSTTTGTYPATPTTGYDVGGATAVQVAVVSASTSSATVLIQGSVNGTFWYTLATVLSPTSNGELWAGPAPAYLRLNLSVHASGTISAFVRTRQMAADPIGHEWKKLDQAAVSFGAGTFSSVTDSGLTATRVPYASTGGLLADSSAFTFTVGTGALGATSFVGAFNGSTVTSSTLTTGRCALTSTAGLLIDSSAALCTASLFTLPSLKVSDLTATRVPFAGAAGQIDDDAAFTFTVGSGTLAATIFSGAFTGGAVTSSTLTAGRLPYVSTAGLIADVANYAYNATTGAMTVTNGTAPSRREC